MLGLGIAMVGAAVLLRHVHRQERHHQASLGYAADAVDAYVAQIMAKRARRAGLETLLVRANAGDTSVLEELQSTRCLAIIGEYPDDPTLATRYFDALNALVGAHDRRTAFPVLRGLYRTWQQASDGTARVTAILAYYTELAKRLPVTRNRPGLGLPNLDKAQTALTAAL